VGTASDFFHRFDEVDYACSPEHQKYVTGVSCTETGDESTTKIKDANNTDKKRNFETFITNNERMTSRRSLPL
jgi:hypothetical protein